MANTEVVDTLTTLMMHALTMGKVVSSVKLSFDGALKRIEWAIGTELPSTWQAAYRIAFTLSYFSKHELDEIDKAHQWQYIACYVSPCGGILRDAGLIAKRAALEVSLASHLN